MVEVHSTTALCQHQVQDPKKINILISRHLKQQTFFVDDGDVTTDKKLGLERFWVAVAFLL